MRKTLLFSLLSLVLSIPIMAQEDPLPGLLKQKQEYKSPCKNPCIRDTVLCNLLDNISWEVKYYNPDSALLISHESLELAKKIKWKKGIARAYSQNGACLKYLARFEEALTDLKKSITTWQEIMKEDPKMTNPAKVGMAKAYIHMGTILQEQGKPNASDSAYLEGYKLATEADNKKIAAGCLGNLAVNFYDRGNYPKAIEYNFSAMKIFEELKEQRSIFVCVYTIGNIYLNQGVFDKAETNLLKALKMAEEMKDYASYADCLNTVADLKIMQGKPKEAIKLRKEAIALNSKNKNYYSLSHNYLSSADDYYQQAMYDSSLIYARKAIATSLMIDENPGLRTGKIYEAMALLKMNKLTEARKNIPVILDRLDENEDLLVRKLAEKFAFDYYKTSGDYKEALLHFQKLSVIEDSLFNNESSKKQMRLEYQYEFDKKAAADSIKTLEEKKVVQAQLKQEQTQRYALYGGIFLILVFAIFMANRFHITSKQKKEIASQKIIVEHQKHIVEEKQKEILDSIHYAERIQKTLLANQELINKEIPESFILFKPKDIVSGDFYWATQTTDNSAQPQFYIIAADSTGHGVPGAFMSLLNITFLNEAINEKHLHEPNKVFNHVRKRLTQSMEGRQDGMDAVLMRIITGTDSIKVDYAAAHNAPVLISNGEMIHLKADKMPVGKGERTEDFTLFQTEAKKGDVLYLFTDGYPDQFGGPQGKKFKYKQLEQLLLSIHLLPMVEQKSILDQRFEEWKGDLEQVDDVCVIGIRL